MPSRKNQKQPPPPPSPSPWLYDMIMSGIEPDLTSTEIEHLEEKYKGETGEQRKERLASYDKAFLVFNDVFGKLTAQCEADAREAGKKTQNARSKTEAAERRREQEEVDRHFDSDS